jgi:hypothetical protein
VNKGLYDTFVPAIPWVNLESGRFHRKAVRMMMMDYDLWAHTTDFEFQKLFTLGRSNDAYKHRLLNSDFMSLVHVVKILPY